MLWLNCLEQFMCEQKPYMNGEAPCNCELGITAGTIPTWENIS